MYNEQSGIVIPAFHPQHKASHHLLTFIVLVPARPVSDDAVNKFRQRYRRVVYPRLFFHLFFILRYTSTARRRWKFKVKSLKSYKAETGRTQTGMKR